MIISDTMKESCKATCYDFLVVSYITVATRCSKYLRRWHGLECVRNLLLPSKPGLAVDLGCWLEVRADLATLVQQDGAEHDLVGTENLLLVVDVGGAVLAVILSKLHVSILLVEVQ